MRLGASRDEWKAEHGGPLVLEGTLAVWTDGSVTIDAGDGVLRPLGNVIADHFEARPDAMGDRFVGRIRPRIRPTVDLMATPVPPPGWGESAGAATESRRLRDLERRLDELQGILEPLLESPG